MTSERGERIHAHSPIFVIYNFKISNCIDLLFMKFTFQNRKIGMLKFIIHQCFLPCLSSFATFWRTLITAGLGYENN